MSDDSPPVEGTEKGPGRRRQGPQVKAGSRDARQVAAVVLEALAGSRTPAEAAGVLGVSLPRYYVLELRALKGLVAGCEPVDKGPKANPEHDVARLKREVARLEREVQRHQALTRATQRAIGLMSAPTPKAEKTPGKKGARRRRKPMVRGLRAVEHLKTLEAQEATGCAQEG